MRKHAESRRADARGDQNDSGFGSWESLANEIRRSPPALLSEIAFAVWRGVPQTRLFPNVFQPDHVSRVILSPKNLSCGNVCRTNLATLLSCKRGTRDTLPRVILEMFGASMKVETGRPSETVSSESNYFMM